ncbi:hypothetical protein CRE_03405 [Caenorhabditis remanei]|uniref:Phlebovirus glycoprotein G2 fusion domain-containing protein n=1 Tax=Caenorhabditis remanei TaxID=31234 RepID=E3NAM2_CAERE|nr:hypothetical protein CRE_03405 [Caenorhabditis remanei]
MTTVQKCTAIQDGPLEGCHSCGGYVPVTCVSRKSMKALVHCHTFKTTLKCGPYGQTIQLLIASDAQ